MRLRTKLLTATVIALVMGSVMTSIVFSTRGAELAKIEREIAETEAVTRELRSKIAQSQSLTDLIESADELGLTREYEVHYLNQTDSLASAR